MIMMMNKETFKKLMDENIAWLKTQENSLEREHILSVLEWAPKIYESHNILEQALLHIGRHFGSAAQCREFADIALDASAEVFDNED